MSPSGKKFDEDALRKKIREQLKTEHTEKQLYNQSQKSPEQRAAEEENESYYLEVYIRHKLEDEVFSRYPEFVKCGNHLDQTKWLTPLELENEYEFFQLEYTFWARFRMIFSFSKRIKIPHTPEIQKMIEELRNEIEADAKERIEKYRQYLKENQQKVYSGKEQKIYDEEQDRFYSSLKGYHKYKNHIGETSWMTIEEFDDQEEFTDRVYTTKDKVRMYSIGAVILIVLISGIWSVVNYLRPDIRRGHLIVNINKGKASLYIDHSLAVGFTPGVAYPVEEGEHQISVISSGFRTDPLSQKVDISIGDTVTMEFNLIPLSGEKGTVKLNVPFSDALIYADGEFRGTAAENKVLTLPVGDHTIAIKKAEYIPSPRLHTFSLNAGDTISLDFHLTKNKSIPYDKTFSSSVNTGLIEINANVSGANIILDGNNTGFETDYVLQKIPFGQHIIRVEKDGYSVYPKEKVIRLSKDIRQAKVDFTLTSTTGLVTILVHPQNAKIYIDNKEASTGNFNGSLALGEHKISFSNVDGYVKPDDQTINVTNEFQNRFDFNYDNDLYFEVKPGTTVPSSLVSVSSGYIMSGVNFKANSSNGPDVVINKKVNQNVWEMGFAFQYKNPPGSDAIFIRFSAPKDLHVTENINLKLWLYSTDENYPLVISGHNTYKIIFNNIIILDKKTPKYDVNEISENNYEEIPLAKYIRSGTNTLIISTADDNTQFMQFWKAVIQ